MPAADTTDDAAHPADQEPIALPAPPEVRVMLDVFERLHGRPPAGARELMDAIDRGMLAGVPRRADGTIDVDAWETGADPVR